MFGGTRAQEKEAIFNFLNFLAVYDPHVKRDGTPWYAESHGYLGGKARELESKLDLNGLLSNPIKLAKVLEEGIARSLENKLSLGIDDSLWKDLLKEKFKEPKYLALLVFYDAAGNPQVAYVKDVKENGGKYKISFWHKECGNKSVQVKNINGGRVSLRFKFGNDHVTTAYLVYVKMNYDNKLGMQYEINQVPNLNSLKDLVGKVIRLKSINKKVNNLNLFTNPNLYSVYLSLAGLINYLGIRKKSTRRIGRQNLGKPTKSGITRYSIHPSKSSSSKSSYSIHPGGKGKAKGGIKKRVIYKNENTGTEVTEVYLEKIAEDLLPKLPDASINEIKKYFSEKINGNEFVKLIEKYVIKGRIGKQGLIRKKTVTNSLIQYTVELALKGKEILSYEKVINAYKGIMKKGEYESNRVKVIIENKDDLNKQLVISLMLTYLLKDYVDSDGTRWKIERKY